MGSLPVAASFLRNSRPCDGGRVRPSLSGPRLTMTLCKVAKSSVRPEYRLRPAEVRRAGLEPATRCLEGSRSVQTELPALDLHARRPRVSQRGYSAAAKGQDC
jgi:hypothetical protein